MSERTNDAVVIRNLRFTYPEGNTAIDNVSLVVTGGETVAIIGPNGAGKSTLLHHIIGLLRQESGTVQVAGYDVVPEQYQAVRRRVGYVFQDPDDQLFSPSLADDVAFGPMHLGLSDEEIGDRVDRALQVVGLEGLGHRAPHRLSAGEKRLAALATVLSYDPDIFVLDEPTANLDPKNRRRLIELLRHTSRTLIVATHDLDLAWELCERSVLLRNGGVIADGPTRRLLADAGLLEANDLELPFRLQGSADDDGEPPRRR